MRQSPVQHICTPGQDVPHAPQFVRSVFRSISQPSAADPLQSANPEMQVKPHVPEVHVRVALARVGHTLLHEPQVAGLPRSPSQPSLDIPLQSEKPTSHV